MHVQISNKTHDEAQVKRERRERELSILLKQSTIDLRKRKKLWFNSQRTKEIR